MSTKISIVLLGLFMHLAVWLTPENIGWSFLGIFFAWLAAFWLHSHLPGWIERRREIKQCRKRYNEFRSRVKSGQVADFEKAALEVIK